MLPRATTRDLRVTFLRWLRATGGIEVRGDSAQNRRMPVSSILSLALVAVQVTAPADVPAKTLRAAETRAARMLASAHANLTFASPAALQVKITTGGLVVKEADAMGFAMLAPDLRHACISWPGVQRAAAQMETDPETLLGAVLAHEIGHLLFGSAHTRGGVMSARLGLREMREAGQSRLMFEGADAREITWLSSPDRGALRPASHP